MSTPIQVPGVLKPDGTLEITQKVNLPAGPVNVTVVPMAGTPPPAPNQPLTRPHGLAELIDSIHQNQLTRGFRGRSVEEIEAGLREGEDK
jgi:hypothetical protein